MVYRTYFKQSKFNAKKTEFNGRKFDSKFEASVAQELELRKKAKDILDYDCQFKVEMWAHDSQGKPKLKMTHKIDFRIHHKDGSYELLEAKGVQTTDYRMRRRWLEELWLPEHLDHTYTVVQQSGYRK